MILHVLVRTMNEPDKFKAYQLERGMCLSISDGREVVVATVNRIDELAIRLDLYPEEMRVPDFVPEDIG